MLLIFCTPYLLKNDLGNQQAVNISAEEQVNQLEYMAQLVTENGSLNNNGQEDYGEAIEEFFLSKL